MKSFTVLFLVWLWLSLQVSNKENNNTEAVREKEILIVMVKKGQRNHLNSWNTSVYSLYSLITSNSNTMPIWRKVVGVVLITISIEKRKEIVESLINAYCIKEILS